MTIREVNLTELAMAEGISESALNAEIRNDPEVPVLKRGFSGVLSRFDLDKGRVHCGAKKEARQATKTARRPQLQLWCAEV